MSVYSQIGGVLLAPANNQSANTVHAAVRCYAVDDVVRRIVEPFSILNLGVCCIWAGRKAESSNDVAVVIAAHITVAQLDVSLYRLMCGVSLRPLRSVASRPHEVPCRIDDFQHPMDVFFGGLPYCQLHFSVAYW